MHRRVTGTIYRTTDEPWVEACVTFVRSPSTYTASKHYPADSVKASTDSLGRLIHDGEVGVKLWCNEGAVSTEYKCFLPHNSFKFLLPVGSDPISLEFLREMAVPPSNPSYPVLKDYVDSRIAGAGIAPLNIPFNSGNLIGGRFLEVIHNFDSNPIWDIIDNNSVRVLPDEVLDISSNKIRIDFLSFLPLPGNWKIILHK